ncbi:MAG TPA: sigma-70 family RNA polymerase sigma factor, partial [Bacteroidota bacterium]|nr:sigma-70 family RNA polymerase sigma factor [Bacteroidota bacterium]
RKEKRTERLDALAGSSGTDASYDPDIALEQEMLEERLRKAVNELPGRCRSVFLLSRIEGKSNAEIAGLLGTSIRTVEHQVSHALRVLRRALGLTPVRAGGRGTAAD